MQFIISRCFMHVVLKALAARGWQHRQEHACGEVGEEAELAVGGLHKGAQAALLDTQRGKILIRLLLFQLLQLCLHLDTTIRDVIPAVYHSFKLTDTQSYTTDPLRLYLQAHSLSGRSGMLTVL